MTGFDQSLDTILARFLEFLPGLITAVVVILVSLILSAWIARGIRLAAERREADPEISILLGRFARWGLLTLGVLIALEQVNFDVTGLIAGLGIAGFTIGFALQDVAKNFVAGILLLLQQPFEIDDTIEVGDYRGKVKNITLRATEMEAIDGRRVIIPNGDVFVSPIVNFTQSTRRRIELEAGVAYSTDLTQAIGVAREAVSSVRGFLPDPEPKIIFNSFASSTVDMTILFWVDTDEASEHKTDPLDAQDEGIRAIKQAFEDAQIDMPMPAMSIVMQNDS